MSDFLISILSALAAWICKHFVDQVAKDLLAQPVDLLRRDLPAIGDRHEGEPLVDVGLGDDVAVDDRGRFDDRGHGLPNTCGFCGSRKDWLLLTGAC